MNFNFPIAVNGFHCQWDENVDELHNEMRFMPPPQYRSPAQERAVLEFSALEQKIKQEQDFNTAQSRGDECCNALQIIPDLIKTEYKSILKPPVYLKIKYNNDKFVYKGTTMSCRDVCNMPEITYKEYIFNDRFYSLIMTDPDAICVGEFIHWVIINIPGNQISKGNEILSYCPPAPPYNSNLHRYIFLLFEQSQKLNDEDIEKSRNYFLPRANVSSISWVETFIPNKNTNEFNVPVGVNGFSATWEEIVDDLHSNMDFMPPEQYRSPKQIIKSTSTSTSNTATTNNNTKTNTKLSEEMVFMMNSYPKIFNGGRNIYFL